MALALQSNHQAEIGLGSTLKRLNSAVERALAKVSCWIEVVKQRRELMDLDDRLLKDIGINRAKANSEGHRHFWDHQ